MDREDGERGVDRAVRERNRLGRRLNRGARPAARCAIMTSDGSTASTVSGDS